MGGPFLPFNATFLRLRLIRAAREEHEHVLLIRRQPSHHDRRPVRRRLALSIRQPDRLAEQFCKLPETFGVTAIRMPEHGWHHVFMRNSCLS